MPNYTFRYVVTDDKRVFRLDGWKPVKEIVNGKWSDPNPIEQSKILNGKVVSEVEADKYAIIKDENFLDNAYPTNKLIDECIYGLAVTLYAYLEEQLDAQFKPKKKIKEYIFKSCLAFSIQVIDRYTQYFEYYDYKEKRITDLLTYGTPLYFNTFFNKRDNEEEISVYIWDLYSEYVKVSDSNNTYDYNLTKLFFNDKNITGMIEESANPISKSFQYLHRTVLSYLREDYSYPKLGENRCMDTINATTILLYTDIYFSSLPLLSLVKEIIKTLKEKINKDR